MEYIKLYVDLDNTLTNFNEAALNLGNFSKALSNNATQEQKQKMYDAIEKAKTSFWANMNWKFSGKLLWNFILPLNPIILSAPGKFKYAPSGKQEWINKNLPGISLYLEDDKYLYAERDAILIDDNKDNIDKWINHGGIGIHHINLKKTIIELIKAIRKIYPTTYKNKLPISLKKLMTSI